MRKKIMALMLIAIMMFGVVGVASAGEAKFRYDPKTGTRTPINNAPISEDIGQYTVLAEDIVVFVDTVAWSDFNGYVLADCERVADINGKTYIRLPISGSNGESAIDGRWCFFLNFDPLRQKPTIDNKLKYFDAFDEQIFIPEENLTKIRDNQYESNIVCVPMYPGYGLTRIVDKDKELELLMIKDAVSADTLMLIVQLSQPGVIVTTNRLEYLY